MKSDAATFLERIFFPRRSAVREAGGAAYQLFLLLLSIYVLIVLVVESFFVSDPEIALVLQRVDFYICLVFLSDFLVNFISAREKLAYMKWGWIDLLSSVPMIEPLRWGRLARIVRILRFFRTVKSLKILIETIQESRFKSLSFVVVLIVLVSYTICASMILELEREVPGGIGTANEALWWAFLNLMNSKVSIHQAQSAGGHVATVILNKVGILLFAYFNAMIVAWLINKRNEGRQALQ